VGAATTGQVLNCFESQLNSVTGGGLAQAWEDCHLSYAHTNCAAISADAGRTFTFTRVTFDNASRAVQFTDAVHGVTFDTCIFNGCGTLDSGGNGTGCTGGYNNISFTSCTYTGGSIAASLVTTQRFDATDHYTGLTFSFQSVYSGCLLTGPYNSTAANWATFTADHTSFASGARDISSGISGNSAALWTNTTRTDAKDSCGGRLSQFSGAGPFTIHPRTDRFYIKDLPDNSTHFQVQIDSATLSGYPDQFTVTFSSDKTNAYLKADATWTDFSGDINIVDGVTQIKYASGTGKFTQLA
jgi:hypothetical protein